MDNQLYDEFGNYIGPELDSNSESDYDGEDEQLDGNNEYNEHLFDDELENSNQQMIQRSDDMDIDREEHEVDNKIVLHEDKKYYLNAEEVYPGVHTVTLDQDAQDITEPIIKPIITKNFSVLEKKIPKLNYDKNFMQTVMDAPTNIRNIAMIGNLHHGKTVFMDTLIKETIEETWDPSKEKRYTDTRIDEQDRALSIKSTPVSLLLEDFNAKTSLLNILDCPGHVNFNDEVTASLRAADGVVVVIDAVEGVMMSTEKAIHQAIAEDVDITVLISKMDRLILELKLPPEAAYFKILHTLGDVNRVIHEATMSEITVNNANVLKKVKRISPELGNVCFSSGQHGWSFTLTTFAHMYCAAHSNHTSNKKHSVNIESIQSQLGAHGSNPTVNQLNGLDSNSVHVEQFARRLWGDWYHDAEHNCFTKDASLKNKTTRTFIKYILEPIYKIYSHVLGENPEEIGLLTKKLKIRVASSELHMDTKPLLRIIFSRYFGYPHGFVNMCLKHIRSPVDGNQKKVNKYYAGNLMDNATGGGDADNIVASMNACDSNGPLMIHAMKMFDSEDGEKFYTLGRIYSGTVRYGQKLKVIGESFIPDEDEEEVSVEVVTGLSVGMGRFSIETDVAKAGNWVLLEGIDHTIKKTCTITDITHQLDVNIFAPLRFHNAATMKVAIEPLLPVELPKMIEAMRKVSKSYPLLNTKVEESGEHVIIGTGELYMDCILHDLRYLYSSIEIKVSDPVVCFNETVVESSALKCYAETPNRLNKITMMCEPMEDGLASDIENNKISLDWSKKTISKFFCQPAYDYDLLASRSVWAFGPDNSPNMFMDDTLSSEVNKSLLYNVKESLIQGFKWSCREGPLCEEPIRNVKFKLLDCSIANEPIHRGGGQMIPTARRCAYSSFLTATPRLMEPVYLVEVQAPVDVVSSIYPVLARRRGHIVHDAPKPGTPFYTVKAYIPVMDSFGFETDIRSYTQGQAFCLQIFDHWSVVPGDPLDENVVLHLLEPSPPLALSKDFMIKTRRRKGLNEDVVISKYIDDIELLQQIQAIQTSGMEME